MNNSLKRRNSKKNQKGGINISELYTLKDELFMLYVLDIVDFTNEDTKKSGNQYTIKLFDADKFKHNTTTTGKTHTGKTKSGKTCSNFTTFLYLIEYLVDIGYLKETTVDQSVSKDDVNLIKLFIPNIGRYEYNYVQQVYTNLKFSLKLEALSPNEYFKKAEVKPFLEKKLFDENHVFKYNYSEIKALRVLYELFLQSKLHLYDKCYLVYDNISGLGRVSQIGNLKTLFEYDYYAIKFSNIEINVDTNNRQIDLTMDCNEDDEPKIDLNQENENDNNKLNHKNSVAISKEIKNKSSQIMLKFAYLVKHILDTINS